MKSSLPCGFCGSWFFSCPTSSLRKSSLPMPVLSATGLAAEVVVVVPVSGDVVVVVVGSIAMVWPPCRSGEDVDERAVGQLERPVEGGLVGLCGAGVAALRAAGLALLVAGGAGTGAGRLVAGRADVDAHEVEALLLERPAQLAGG